MPNAIFSACLLLPARARPSRVRHLIFVVVPINRRRSHCSPPSFSSRLLPAAAPPAAPAGWG
eukprot:8630583-Pyramimonas_sp.AAC.1